MSATKHDPKVRQRGGKVRPVRKTVPAPPPTPRPDLPIRITGDLLDRIDALRPDMVAREPFVRHVLDIGLKRLERRG
jgi:hypothetical protein